MKDNRFIPHNWKVGSRCGAEASARLGRSRDRRAQSRFLWFDKQPVSNTGFHTLDESIWKPLLSAEGRAEPETALEKLALLTVDESGITRATVAGVLLCAAVPHEWLPNACITATLYAGADRASSQLDARTIVGPLPRQVADAMAFAVRNMRVGAYKDPARMGPPAVQRGSALRGPGQRRGAPGLFHARQPHPPVHVRRPPGDRLSGRPAEQPDHRCDGCAPVDTERSHCVGARAHSGRRYSRVRAAAVLHGASSEGTEMAVRVMAIVGRSALLEYRVFGS